MNEIVLNIISVVVTAVVIPLISIGGTQLIKLINKKIQNTEAAKHLTAATNIVLTAVRSVFQTYVETLKAQGNFDAHSQTVALTKAKDIALSQLTEDTKAYIKANFGDLDNWLTNQIESTINLLKNK